MSDQDFDFAPPPPRRERKEFEPPPWEKHLFEQVAKEKSQEQEIDQVLVPAVAVEPEPGPEVTKATEKQAVTGVSSVSTNEGTDTQPQLDEVQLAAMMFELRAEEVPATGLYAKATLMAGAILLLIGIVMVIWSFVMITVAMRGPEQGRQGVYVGLTVLVFGAGFAGTGAWFVFKTLRQQGVL